MGQFTCIPSVGMHMFLLLERSDVLRHFIAAEYVVKRDFAPNTYFLAIMNFMGIKVRDLNRFTLRSCPGLPSMALELGSLCRRKWMRTRHRQQRAGRSIQLESYECRKVCPVDVSAFTCFDNCGVKWLRERQDACRHG
jgi:hypothetical protein